MPLIVSSAHEESEIEPHGQVPVRMTSFETPISPLKAALLNGYCSLSQPWRRWRNARAAAQRLAPIVVIYYHRVADDDFSDWTFTNKLFRHQVAWLQDHFELVSLDEAQRRLREGNDRLAVHLTFDDGYATNCDYALPLLVERRIPCTYFVTGKHILEQVPFPHDATRGRPLAPNTLEELKALAAAGIEIGFHTRTHVNVGSVREQSVLVDELVTSRDELQAALGHPIRHFAFPYGQYCHLSTEAFRVAREAGYASVSSAYGGYNVPGDDPFHIQRIAADRSLARMRNWLTIDPRKEHVPRFPALAKEAAPRPQGEPLPSAAGAVPAKPLELPNQRRSQDDRPVTDDAPTGPVADSLAASVLMMVLMLVGQRVIGFLRTLLFCRWMEPTELGKWDLSLAFFMLAAPLIVLGVPGSFGRYVERFRRQGQLRSFVRRVSLLIGGLAGLAAVALLAWPTRVSTMVYGKPDQAHLVGWLVTGLVLVLAFNYLNDLVTSLRLARVSSVMQMTQGLGFAVFGCLGLMFWQSTAVVAIAAFGLACVPAIVMALWTLRRSWPSWHTQPHPWGWQEMALQVAPFAAWMWVANAATNLFSYVDRYILLHHCGLRETEALDLIGNYHTARVIPLLLASLAVTICAVALPHLSRDWEAGRRAEVTQRTRAMLKLLSLSLTAAGTLVLMFGSLLFDTLLRSKFASGADVLNLTLAFGVWSGLQIVAFNYLWCSERPGLVSIALASGLICNATLNLLWAPAYGLPGACAATAIANLVTLYIGARFGSLQGLKLDLGCWIAMVLPAALMAGKWAALAAVCTAGAFCLWTNRLLIAEEKAQLLGVAKGFWKRLRSRNEDVPATLES